MKCGYGFLIIGLFLLTARLGAVPRFQLKNNSGKYIAVTLYTDAKAQQELEHIQMASMDGVESANDAKINRIKAMKISYCNDGFSNCSKDPDNVITVAFDIGKMSPEEATYYLKFYIKQGEPVIEAQKGSGLFSKKTTDGYSLEKNVKKINQVNIKFTPQSKDKLINKLINKSKDTLGNYQLETIDDDLGE